MSFGFAAATWAAVSSIAAGVTATGVLAGAAVVGAASMIKQADTARRVGNTGNDRAREAATATAQDAERATNRANAKTPDVAAMMAANALAGASGQSGTMLTGPGGVDPSLLTLGKSTLLGG